MAISHVPNEHEDEEYIDMEINSFSNFFSHSKNSLLQTREFEFQNMSSISIDRHPTTSFPADELFYKGKLLPLHLPPRLQMVEKLLQNSSSVYQDREEEEEDKFEDKLYSTPLATAVTTPLTSTPFESCNVSPAESYRVSRELNLDEYLYDQYDSTDVNQKKSWTKRLKLIKQSSAIGSKLKAASRAYLKSFFGKSSGCLNESCAAAKVADEGSVSKAKFQSFSKDNNGGNRHRRSFSLAIKRHSTNKLPSSSNGNFQFLKRSCSVNGEIENPIQGAIAHCKQSQKQQLMRSRKSSTISFYEDEDRLKLCRG